MKNILLMAVCTLFMLMSPQSMALAQSYPENPIVVQEVNINQPQQREMIHLNLRLSFPADLSLEEAINILHNNNIKPQYMRENVSARVAEARVQRINVAIQSYNNYAKVVDGKIALARY